MFSLIKRYLHHRRVCKRLGIKPFGLISWLLSDNNGGVGNVLL